MVSTFLKLMSTPKFIGLWGIFQTIYLIWVASSEDRLKTMRNWHTIFKNVYQNTNRHIDQIASQLLQDSIDQSTSTSSGSNIAPPDDSDCTLTELSPPQSELWSTLTSQSIDLVNSQSGQLPPSDIANSVLSINIDENSIWRQLKAVSIHPTVPSYHSLRYRTVYGGDYVYGRRNRRDGVAHQYCGRVRFGILDTVLTPTPLSLPSHLRLVLIRRLREISPDEDKQAVVQVYGNCRFAYDLSDSNFVKKVLLDSSALVHPIILVPDAYWMMKTYGEFKSLTKSKTTYRHKSPFSTSKCLPFSNITRKRPSLKSFNLTGVLIHIDFGFSN